MLERLQNFISQEVLLKEDARVMLAVSGGIDSMVLLDLFMELTYPLTVLHCNFNLRDEESDQDAIFVQSFCTTHGLSFYSKSFDTRNFAQSHGLSIQMAARQLRYDWFKEMLQKENYDCVALAHQSDDLVETFHINLLRGTGIKGLAGIPVKNEYFIRPLLWAQRAEIQHYADRKPVPYREDSSNAETKYVRNQLRHQLLPEFRKINPGYTNTVLNTIQYLSQANKLLESQFQKWKTEVIDQTDLNIQLSISKLMNREEPLWFLNRYLADYGFNSRQTTCIFQALDGESGKQFHSSQYRLVKDRSHLILSEHLPAATSVHYMIDLLDQDISLPVPLVIKHHPCDSYQIRKSNQVAALDFDRLEFPLTFRHWRKGDCFQPLGMQNPKKLSDYFIDNKYSLPDKENAWLICSGDQIVWILGDRINHKYRISSNTKTVYELEWKR